MSSNIQSLSPDFSLGGGNPIFDKILQWGQYQREYNNLIANLKDEIQTMVKMLKNGNVEEAYMYAQENILPDALKVKGGYLSVIGGSMNIATAIRQLISGVQSDTNTLSTGSHTFTEYYHWYSQVTQKWYWVKGSPPSGTGYQVKWVPDAATAATLKDLHDKLQDLWNIFGQNYNTWNSNKANTWMDSGTWSSIQSSLKSFLTQLGLLGPSDSTVPNGALKPFSDSAWDNAGHDIWTWTHPNTGQGHGNTGGDSWHTLMGNLDQLNSDVSALSQGENTQLQFYTNGYNQITAALKQMLQDSAKAFGVFVQNEKVT